MDINEFKQLINDAFFGNAIGLMNVRKTKEFYDELVTMKSDMPILISQDDFDNLSDVEKLNNNYYVHE